MARTNATNRTTRQEHSPSASFNGSSTGITLGFKANSTGFTIAAWIKVRRFTSGDRIFDQQDSGPSKGFAVLMPVTASDRSLYFSVFGDSSEEANIKIALNIWEWTHIAISFEPNSAKFYKNGVLAGTDTSVSLGDSVTNLVIGKNASSAANYFNGLMKDFVVYDRVLSLAEVENVRDGIVSQTNLKCHLPLSSDLADISVNGNDGTGTAVFTYTNDSPFYDAVGLNMYAPLKSSLLLERGVGYPTWSRATKAWGFNELGYLEELASGCAFFGGARLVRNWCSPNAETEDVSAAGWLKTNVTITGQDTVVCSAGTSYQRINVNAGMGTRAIGEKFRISARLTCVDHQFVQVLLYGVNQRYANFDLVNGTYSVDASNTVAASITAVSAGVWDVVAIIPVAIVGANPYYGFFSFCTDLSSTSSATFAGDGVKSFKITRISIVDVTNYDASYVPEYVSVGVVSSPYHGAGIDGAKYFETDWQGAPIPAANLLGFRREAAATNNLLHSRDLSNAAWSTKTNVTAAKTATGLDGIANTATTLTAAAAGAIILQPITLASADRCASAYVKRRTGTGTISFTQDGTNWTDITSQINSSTWSRVEITATLANPSVGFKISTSGDAIDVDCVQNEAGAVATSPIVTTTATVTRNEDSLTYQTASNWSDTAGTVFVQISGYEVDVDKKIFGGANGIYSTTLTSGVYASDGTTTVRGPIGAAMLNAKIAMSWGGITKTISVNGSLGAVDAYDGAWSPASLAVGGKPGYIGPVAIYNYQMTDAELQALTT